MENAKRRSSRPLHAKTWDYCSREPAHTVSRKPKPIIYRLARLCKRIKWAKVAEIAVLLLTLGVIVLAVYGGCALVQDIKSNDAITATAETDNATTEAVTFSEPEDTGYIFKYGEGYAVDMEHLTDAWAAEAGFSKRYELTDDERLEIAQVLTAEAGAEPYAGMVAVAQCILQTCEDEDMRPHEVLSMYSYSKRRPDPTEEALEAVEAVFDFGQVATSEPIKYFYAPALTDSEWHESQEYVMTINGHKFFKEAADDDTGADGD